MGIMRVDISPTVLMAWIFARRPEPTYPVSYICIYLFIQLCCYVMHSHI